MIAEELAIVNMKKLDMSEDVILDFVENHDHIWCSTIGFDKSAATHS